MAKSGCLGKVLLILLLVLVLLAAGIIFFPTAQPHVVLPAETIFEIGGFFPVTNSLLASWLTMIVVIALFVGGTRGMKLVPGRFQNLIEMAIESLLNFVEGVAGKDNGRRFFPIIATIFIFVLFNAWLSLLPGFSTIGFGPVEEFKGAFFGGGTTTLVEAPILRAANTDINTPLAIALISFFCVEFWGIRSLGFRRYAGKFVRVRQLMRGKIFMGAIDLIVGGLEALSELIRIVSFTFRLFGNMTAGEVLLFILMYLIPWVVAVPFYGLEAMLGFIQALIFAGLTLVFATVAVSHHGEEH